MVMSKKWLLIFVPLILLLGASGVYFYQKYQKVALELKNIAPQGEDEVKKLLSKVGELIDLPTDEMPSVATVTDKEKLVGQKFFVKAENGDKVIIYAKAEKALLYRPGINKIIEVARVDTNIGNGEPTTPVVSVTPALSSGVLSIYNGTAEVGLSQKLAEYLKGKVELKVAQKSNASRNDYTKSLVVDLTKKATQDAQKIADLVSGGVLDLKMPVGEATPSADILVILGSNFTEK